MQHNDFTVALEDGRWVPRDHPRVLQQHFGLMHDGKVTVSTAGTDKHGQHQHGGIISQILTREDTGARGWVRAAVAQPSQPALSLAQVVVAAELVVREKRQCVRCSIWWGEGGPALRAPDLA